MKAKAIEPIGYVKSPFSEKFGIPRQANRVPSIKGSIIFYPPYSSASAFKMLEGYSHLWIIFDFDKAENSKWKATVRPPRLGGNKRVGVFATRSPFRPNGLGLSLVKIDKIYKENNGIVIDVLGLDLLDKTPVYDIKPYLPESDYAPNALGGFAKDFIDYKLKVIANDKLLEKIPKEDRQPIIECLSQDVRPSYQEDENRIYGFAYNDTNVKFKVKELELTIVEVEKK